MSNKSINDRIRSAAKGKSREQRFPADNASSSKVNAGIRDAWRGGNGLKATKRIVEDSRKKTNEQAKAAAIDAAKKAAQAGTIDAHNLRDEVQKMVDEYLDSGSTNKEEGSGNEGTS